MRDEPEAVSRSEQQRQSLAAERKERARRIAAWSEMRSTVDAALNSFMEVVGATAGRNVVSSVRAIRRSADQLGRRL